MKSSVPVVQSNVQSTCNLGLERPEPQNQDQEKQGESKSSMVEFKVTSLSSSYRLEDSDFDTILTFLKNSKLSSGMLIKDYRITSTRSILVSYKSEEVKREVLEMREFYVSTGVKNFKLTTFEPLNHSNESYAEIKNVLVLITKSELEFNRARVFCENLNANAKINNELKSIRRSLLFSNNAFILEFKNEIDFNSLVKWNESFTFLNAYSSRTLLVKQRDTHGKDVDQELIEHYFRRNAVDKFCRIFVSEPFYLVEYENDAVCETILAQQKHHILNHELQIEYLYNFDMMKSSGPLLKVQKSDNAKFEVWLNSDEQLTNTCKGAVRLKEIIRFQLSQLAMVKARLSKVYAGSNYTNMTLGIDEPGQTLTLRRAREQIDAFKSSMKRLLNKVLSRAVQVKIKAAGQLSSSDIKPPQKHCALIISSSDIFNAQYSYPGGT